jgi:arsenite methyltransferase
MQAHDSSREVVREKVRAGYRQIALHGSERRKSSCCNGMSAVDSEKLACQIGYSVEELAELPDGANIGLSCGNPSAVAALRPGEVLLDLGSGGGFDAFIAGPKVGASGRVIGVDMTQEMLAKARKNIATDRERTGLDNVEFRIGEIERLPVADGTVDAVISNCVINLSPDKAQVWCEIARVLKPGGRVAISDLALLQPLPPAVVEMVEALVGCIAGAVLVSETERIAREAGLSEIRLNPKTGYVDSLVEWQDPLYQKIVAHLPPGKKPGDYLTSLEITARKPALGDKMGAPAAGVFESGSCCCSAKNQ